jgi:hypothetical protein
MMEEIAEHYGKEFTEVLLSPPDSNGPLFGVPEWVERLPPAARSSAEFLYTAPGILSSYIGNELGLQESVDGFLAEHPTLEKVINVASNALDYTFGAGLQFVDDMTFGFFGSITGIQWQNGGQAFQGGRRAGRTGSTIVGALELVIGGLMVEAGIKSIPPTAAAAATCGAATEGVCLVVGGPALVIEGTMVVGGAAVAGHGGLVLFRNSNNPLSSTSNNPQTHEFASPEQLESHFEKHGAEFGYNTPDEYLDGARRLISDQAGVETFTRSNGDILYYLESTNEFCVVSSNGTIRTYFKPQTGRSYWEALTRGAR